MVVSHEAQEALDFCHVAWWFPVYDFFNFGFLYMDLLSSYMDPKVVDLGLFKLALINIKIKVVLS